MENERDKTVVQVRPRTWRPKRLMQFSLRTLLIAITLAGIGCWWVLRPRMVEGELSAGKLMLSREVQSRWWDYLRERSQTSYPTLGTRFEWGGHMQVNVGRWQLRNESNDVIVAGRFQRNEPHGRWATLYPNGQKAAEGMMLEGAKNGLWRTWSEEGKRLSEVQYATYKTTRLLGGIGGPSQVESTESFLDGPARAWYPNGKLRSEGRYAKNCREGLWTFYNEDGAIEATGEYHNDGREGEWSVREDGVVRKVRYFEGMKDAESGIE